MNVYFVCLYVVVLPWTVCWSLCSQGGSVLGARKPHIFAWLSIAVCMLCTYSMFCLPRVVCSYRALSLALSPLCNTSTTCQDAYYDALHPLTSPVWRPHRRHDFSTARRTCLTALRRRFRLPALRPPLASLFLGVQLSQVYHRDRETFLCPSAPFCHASSLSCDDGGRVFDGEYGVQPSRRTFSRPPLPGFCLHLHVM